MQYVDGLVLRTTEDVAAYDRAAKADLADRLVDTLAAVHAVDVDRSGLSDLGRPEGYLAPPGRSLAASPGGVGHRQRPA